MRSLKKHAIDFYLYVVLILTMALGHSAIAFADSGPATVTINAGGLSLSGPPSVNATLPPVYGRGGEDGDESDFRDPFATYTLPLTVIDARGTGAGWNLTISSTAFSSGLHRLPNFASRIFELVARCNTGNTCTPPTEPCSLPGGRPSRHYAASNSDVFQRCRELGPGELHYHAEGLCIGLPRISSP